MWLLAVGVLALLLLGACSDDREPASGPGLAVSPVPGGEYRGLLTPSLRLVLDESLGDEEQDAACRRALGNAAVRQASSLDGCLALGLRNDLERRILARESFLPDVTREVWTAVTLAFAPYDQYRAVRTAWCESRLEFMAVGSGVGLWQIPSAHLDSDWLWAFIWEIDPSRSRTVASAVEFLLNPHMNAAVAGYVVAYRGGWDEWPETKDGCAGWASSD
jgi:hypothetical protein